MYTVRGLRPLLSEATMFQRKAAFAQLTDPFSFFFCWLAGLVFCWLAGLAKCQIGVTGLSQLVSILG